MPEPRRITISCPGCLNEHADITVDEAERILFHGCKSCREERRPDDEDGDGEDLDLLEEASNGH